jgi:hypothetical protein
MGLIDTLKESYAGMQQRASERRERRPDVLLDKMRGQYLIATQRDLASTTDRSEVGELQRKLGDYLAENRELKEGLQPQREPTNYSPLLSVAAAPIVISANFLVGLGEMVLNTTSALYRTGESTLISAVRPTIYGVAIATAAGLAAEAYSPGTVDRFVDVAQEKVVDPLRDYIGNKASDITNTVSNGLRRNPAKPVEVPLEEQVCLE